MSTDRVFTTGSLPFAIYTGLWVKRTHVQVAPEVAVFDVNRRLVYHGRIDNLYEDFGRARNAPTTHELADAIAAAIHGEKLQMDAVPSVGCYISDLE